jgi:hypothetical protein
VAALEAARAVVATTVVATLGGEGRGGKGSDDANAKLKTVVMEAAVAVVKRRLQLWWKVDRQRRRQQQWCEVDRPVG